MKFKWNFYESAENSIIEQFRLSRKYDDNFFASGIENLPDASLLKDVERASERIIQAVQRKEKIIIFGHDDPDGITSTYILFDFLEKIGSQNHYYYIPNRLLENHGLQQGFIDKVKDGNFDLVITVDGGVSSYDSIEIINEMGVEVIVTDHHLIPDKLPQAFAIVNPKQHNCRFPDKMIAGVGVCWFLLQNTAKMLSVELDENYLIWVAIGSLADKVPLTKASRIFVKEAQKIWDDSDDVTLNILKRLLRKGPGNNSTPGNIRFIMRILSNGRESDGKNKSMRLLLRPLSKKEKILEELLADQKKYNDKIRVYKEYIKTILPEDDDIVYIFSDTEDKLQQEFMGMCATFISQDFKIPVFIMKIVKDKVICEARSTDSVNLMECFRSCQNLLTQFGGHVKAAGFTADSNKLEDIMQALHDYAELYKEAIIEQKKIDIDIVLDADKIQDFDEIINCNFEEFQPFGQGNPTPVFLLRNYTPIRDWKKVRIQNSADVFDVTEKYDIVFSVWGNSIFVHDYNMI
jgi:single-stranded-DNA-specific exonuclease